MKRIIPIILAVVVAFHLKAQSYVWPTNASRLMTSSFCEYRAGHFHAGIDIKTWGEEGYDVYAIQSGTIQRIRVSPYGYGKAIYLKLDNGLTVVYGHLSRFRKDIESYVNGQQKASQRYEQALYLSPSQFPVRSGDLVGFTGSTGIGAPHLHFEIRDSRERPFNPLDLGYLIHDTIAPVIHALALVPLEYGSHVAGDFIPAVIPVQSNSENPGIIPVWGEIGVAVSTYDRANGAANRFSPVSLQLTVDDSLVFQTRYSRFSYDETSLVDLDRDFMLRQRGIGEYQNLYRHPQNTLDFYSPGQASGVLHCKNAAQGNTRRGGWSPVLGTGIHHLTVRVSDYWKNSRSANLWIEVKPLQDILNAVPESVPVNSVKPFELSTLWLNDFIRFQFQGVTSADRIPWLSVWLNNHLQISTPMSVSSEGKWIGVMPLNSIVKGLMICQVKIDTRTVLQDTMRIFYLDQTGGTIYSSDRRMRCIFPERALYGPCWLHIEQTRNPGTGSMMYQILPETVLLKKSVHLTFRLTQEEKSGSCLGIYAIQETPHFISGSLEPITGNLAGYTRYLSGLTILQDTIAPRITWFTPDSAASLMRADLKIALGFEDDQSGISGEENYRVWIDDQLQVVAYDPEQHAGIVEHPSVTVPGIHRIRFELTDLAGNETVKQFPVIIR